MTKLTKEELEFANDVILRQTAQIKKNKVETKELNIEDVKLTIKFFRERMKPNESD